VIICCKLKLSLSKNCHDLIISFRLQIYINKIFDPISIPIFLRNLLKKLKSPSETKIQNERVLCFFGDFEGFLKVL